MRRNIAAFVSAFIFALGLGLGGMTDPAKVTGFLDFGGQWDPALLFVMGGAVGVYAIGYRLIVRRTAPLLPGGFALPVARQIDGRLIAGAALFGVGWGLGGLCPGPALTSMATGTIGVFVFIGTMVIGLLMVPSPKALPAFVPPPTGSVEATTSDPAS